MKLSNKQYDIIKWVALVVIPALATLVLTVGKIWGLPYYDNIGATISAFGLFLAAIIGVSTSNYKATAEQTTFNADGLEGMEGEGYETEDETADEQ